MPMASFKSTLLNSLSAFNADLIYSTLHIIARPQSYLPEFVSINNSEFDLMQFSYEIMLIVNN